MSNIYHGKMGILVKNIPLVITLGKIKFMQYRVINNSSIEFFADRTTKQWQT